jgi:hypothetical protein
MKPESSAQQGAQLGLLAGIERLLGDNLLNQQIERAQAGIRSHAPERLVESPDRLLRPPLGHVRIAPC